MLKGILLSVALFVVAFIALWYRFSPPGARFAPIGLEVRFLFQTGKFLTGFGLMTFLLGAGMLWLGRVFTLKVSALLSQMPK